MSVGDHLSQAPSESSNSLDQVGVGRGVGNTLLLHCLADNADAPLDRQPPVRLAMLPILAQPLPVILAANLFSLECFLSGKKKKKFVRSLPHRP